MNFKQHVATGVLVACSLTATAQGVVDSLAEYLVETAASSSEESEADAFDLTEISDRLAWHLRHPLDLNQASAEDLDALFILNDLQISALLEHIRRTGPLIDILELQTVPNFDVALVRRLRPFVTLKSRTGPASLSPQKLFDQPEQELLVYFSRVLARQKGFKKGSSYPGSPERLTLRYRFRQGKLFRLHLLAEKDPGEVLLKDGKLSGFDFYSGNLALQPADGVLRKLVIGDYLLQFGQGLSLWNGFSLGKGPAALNIGRQAAGIRPHNSSGEGFFFRGAAVSLGWGKIQVSPFFSSRKLDATAGELAGSMAVSAIRRSGLHRTAGELSAQKTLRETVAGVNMTCQLSDQFAIGFTGHRVAFDKPLLAGDDLYELDEFSGHINQVFSLDYTFGRSNYYLFGEVARSQFPAWRGGASGKGWAFIQGLLFSPAQGLVVAASWRNYSRSYQALYASPFGESSNGAGEQGLYLGLECKPVPNWTLNAYADAFSWSWLRYRVDAPSRGFELMAQLTYRPNKQLMLYGRYRTTRKPRNQEVPGNKLRAVLPGTHQTARIHAEYQFSRRLRLRARVDRTFYRIGTSEATSGFSLYQDLAWTPGKIGFQARFTYFSTDNYDTRIYSYESSLMSGASLAFFYDRGFKTYLGVRWKPWNGLDLRMRSSLLNYFNRARIGSGPDEIAGKRKPDLRIQMRLSF